MWANFTGVDFLWTGLKHRKRKENSSSLLYVLHRHFHVVVVQKSVMHVQSCCCANQTYCFFAVPVAVAVVVAKAPY